MNISGSVVRSYASGMVASHKPSESRAPIPLNALSAVHEQVVEGEVLSKRVQPESLYSKTSMASGDKMNRYLQYAQNNMQEISVGYYVDYFA